MAQIKEFKYKGHRVQFFSRSEVETFMGGQGVREIFSTFVDGMNVSDGILNEGKEGVWDNDVRTYIDDLEKEMEERRARAEALTQPQAEE